MTYIKILALDQATGISGVAIFCNDKLIKYDKIDLKKIKDSKLRFEEMAKSISKYIEKEKPNAVVFEDVSLQTNVSTLVLLAQLQGVIMQSCFANDIPFKIYKPTSWRKYLHFIQNNKIKRKELKQQSMDFVFKKYKVKVKDDISDAICIGEAYIIEENS